MTTKEKIISLSRQIKGFTPLASLVPDCIDCEKELAFIEDYLSIFETDLTAENYYSFIYGKNLAK